MLNRMENPKICWVMPAYNAAGFIAEAIDSVVAQTVTGWELIVVDDGSTDNTADIAARYADSDPRIRLLRMPAPSGSAYQPRKLAIEETGAEVVAPLDERLPAAEISRRDHLAIREGERIP